MTMTTHENGSTPQSAADAAANQYNAVLDAATRIRSTAFLDPQTVPKIVGRQPVETVRRLYNILSTTPVPLYLIGDSGTGKSATMKKLLQMYSMHHNVPAYYFQLSPEDTKTSVIQGHRLVNGTLIPFDGILSQAAKEGAIVGIDEITHSTQQMLLNLNSFDGSDSIIATGDRSINAQRLRIIFGSNMTNVAGNIRVPASFASRVIGIPFTYPPLDDEIRITMSIFERNFDVTSLQPQLQSVPKLPDSVVRYICAFVASVRGPQLMLSSRNSAHALILLQHEQIFSLGSNKTKKDPVVIDKYFTTGANNESIRKMITERIIGKAVNDVSVLQRPEVMEFLQYVSAIGVEKFREAIRIACGYYIDIDGAELWSQSQKQTLMTKII